MPQHPNHHRDFLAELQQHDAAIESANAARTAFLEEWAESLKARIPRLKNPETGERLSIRGMQPLLGIKKTSRQLHGALGHLHSVPLLMQCDQKVRELEAAGLWTDDGPTSVQRPFITGENGDDDE